MARRYPEVMGLTSWITSVYQARAEVEFGGGGDIEYVLFVAVGDVYLATLEF
jgi:hypothetical protein